MAQRIRNISAILLKCAICNLVCAGQHVAQGAEMAMPPRLVAMMSEKPLLVATASQAAEGDIMAIQQTRNVDAPVAPTTSARERKSLSPLPSRKQRRRKPRMAGIPTGTQAVAQAADEAGTQVAVQETREADTTTRPQATAQKTETGDPFAPTRPQQATATEDEGDDPFAPAKPQAKVQVARKPEGEDPFAPQAAEKPKVADRQYRMAMAPIRWRASVSEMISWLYSNSNALSAPNTSFQHVQSAGMSLSSYIMRPYIASVGGGIGVTSSAASNGETRSRSNRLYGNGRLSMFSRSRFPFTMSFNSNSNTNSQSALLPSYNQQTRSLSLFQSYRPLTGTSRYRGTFSSENAASNLNDSSSSKMLEGVYLTRFGSEEEHPFEANMRLSRRNRQDEGIMNTSMLLTRHTYLPADSLLTLSSNASLITTNQRATGDTLNYNTQIFQASSIADWQPENEDVPLFVTGGVRLLRSLNTGGGISANQTQSLGGTATASYIASPNLTYNANGSMTRASSGATSSFVTTQGGSASYRGNAIRIKQATYSWYGNGGASNVTGPTPDSGVSGAAGHLLAGDYTTGLFGKRTRLRYGLNQSFSGTTSRVGGQSGTLVNGGTLGWASSGNDILSAGASLSVTDTRTFGKDARHSLSVLLSFGGAGREGYGYKASIYGINVEADATIEALYQQQRDQSGSLQGETRIIPAARGSATYYKGGIFGVRRLLYSGTLRASVLPYSPQTIKPTMWNPLRYDFTQSLTYRIGMNEARLVGNLNQQHNGLKNASLFLQFMAWRTIGN